MGTINVTYLPCTKVIPTGAQTVVCNLAGKKFLLEIPSGMYSSTIYVRFYNPYTSRSSPNGNPLDPNEVAGQTFDMSQTYGPGANRGYTFKLQVQTDQSPETGVICHVSVDDVDPGNWIPAAGRDAWNPNPTDGLVGGRFNFFGCFACFK